MRKLLLLIFISLTGYAYGQDAAFGNFKIAEQEIIYQKVFSQDSITVAKLEKYYKSLPFVKRLSVTADGLTFNIEDFVIDFKKFQFSQVGTPSIMQTGKFSGKVTVGLKDGRYRATFQSIQVTGDIGYKKITEKDPLTNYACKNSGTIFAQDWCRPNMLGLLDMALTDKFEFKKPKDDW
ncbi:hypothetical protein BH09BAC3_BH09BAC3_17220 [soil metagenome]